MKNLLIAVILSALTISPTFAQTRKFLSGRALQQKRDATRAMTKKAALDLKTTKFGKWGVVSLSLPAKIGQLPMSEELSRNENITWTDYVCIWEGSPREPYKLLSQYQFKVTTWNAAFSDALQTESDITPEIILATNYSTAESSKNKGKLPIEELQFLVLDGVKGIFSVTRDAEEKQEVWVVWESYRYFQNKAQRISLVIRGNRSNLAAYKEIFDSLKLSK